MWTQTPLLFFTFVHLRRLVDVVENVGVEAGSIV